MFQEIKASLEQLYREDARPWLVGFSGGKDSTMLASLIFDAVLSIPAQQRKKPISILCTDTRVEIPAIAEMIEGTLDRMRKCSQQNGLNIEANHVAPTFRSACADVAPTFRSAHADLKAGATMKESFWVNIIGRVTLPPTASSAGARSE